MSYGNPRHGTDRNLDRNRNANAERAENEHLVVGRAGTPDEGELPPGPDAERNRGDADAGGEQDENDRSRDDR